VFAQGVSGELGMTQQTVDALFPRLDDLVRVHSAFLGRLLHAQSLSADKSVDRIGPLLQQQASSSLERFLAKIFVGGWPLPFPPFLSPPCSPPLPFPFSFPLLPLPSPSP